MSGFRNRCFQPGASPGPPAVPRAERAVRRPRTPSRPPGRTVALLAALCTWLLPLGTPAAGPAEHEQRASCLVRPACAAAAGEQPRLFTCPILSAVEGVIRGDPAYDDYSARNLKNVERSTPWEFSLNRRALRGGTTTHGLPGLFDIPTATSLPSGSIDFGYNWARDSHVDRLRDVPSQRNYSFSVGFVDRITIGIGAVQGHWDDGRTSPNDLFASVHALLVKEGRWWPSLALGWQDFSGGNQIIQARYVVLSKSFLGHLRTTVGYGKGPDILDGFFAGGELALNRYVALIGEYNSDHFTAGTRIFPLPEYLEARGLPRLTVDLLWQEDDGFAAAFNVRWVLGETKFRAQQEARSDKRYERPASFSYGSAFSLCTHLQQELVDHGFENVQVSLMESGDEKTVVVQYENRLYNRDQLHGLGVVLGLAATNLPAEISQVSVVMRVVNIPVMQFTTTIDDFLDYVNDRTTKAAYARKVRVSNNAPRLEEFGTVAADTSRRNRSWLKLDVFVHPKFDTLLFWGSSAENSRTADLQFRLLPEGRMQLLPGMTFSMQGDIPVVRTDEWPADLPSPEISRILLNQAFRVPLPAAVRPFAAAMTQFSAGQFSVWDVGVANQTVFSLLDGYLFLGGTVGGFGRTFSEIDNWIALGNVRGRYPPWNITLNVTGGRFLFGDKGVEATVSRFFGSTDVGLFIRHSDFGSVGGIRFALPLCFSKSLKPMIVRPRLPDVFSYAQQTTIFTDENIIRLDIAQTMQADNEIERVYWNRDRLYPAYVKANLHTLRNAVRRWVDE